MVLELPDRGSLRRSGTGPSCPSPPQPASLQADCPRPCWLAGPHSLVRSWLRRTRPAGESPGSGDDSSPVGRQAWFWCRLQRDHRDRARSKPARKPRRDDVGPAHRALRRTRGPGDRSRSRAQPRRERARHRARVRHPRRPGRCRLRLGAAGTPALILGATCRSAARLLARILWSWFSSSGRKSHRLRKLTMAVRPGSPSGT